DPDFHPGQLPTFLSAALLGLIAGGLALFLTVAVYAMEDGFHHLPIHWMWWPALGGLAVGIGGFFQPHALGVGYDLIEHLLKGDVGDILSGDNLAVALLALIAVKCCIWATALGSGTSGGVLAPLLIMGGALGAIAGTVLHLPGGDARLWALVGMAAV